MKKAILYINPGPAWQAHTEAYQLQYVELSKHFTGYILTTSNKKEKLEIGNFKFVSMKWKNTMMNIFAFALFCIWNALKLRMKNEKIDLVSTYDPLKTGLIGIPVSWILGAKFAPEVKGVYTSPAEWMDNENSFETIFKRRFYPLIMKIVLRSADGIRLLFNGQVNYFGNILNGKVIRDFPSYVAIDEFINLREEKEILFVGYPFKRKGLDILIAAFKKISPKYPDWRLKIIGWYPNPVEVDKSIHNNLQIVRLDPIPHKQMLEQIGSCAVLVLPSRSEAMGRVLVEAMAAGKPRIGSNIDGIPTVIEDGVDGLLVETDNIEDLTEKLEYLMCNQEIRKKLGKNGENRARKEFTIERYCNNLEKFYMDVVNMNL